MFAQTNLLCSKNKNLIVKKKMERIICRYNCMLSLGDKMKALCTDFILLRLYIQETGIYVQISLINIDQTIKINLQV